MRLRLVIAAVVLAGCATPSADPSTSRPATSLSPSATETQCWKSPLTGLCADRTQPVLVVKIDDVGAARPQFHLNEADVVIVEPVEGGLTRLFAVYQSHWPEVVGPVRSARITDTDLAPAFGTPAFAYSGSMTKLRPLLERADLQLVGAPQGGEGYERVDTRAAPHNLIARPSELLARIPNLQAALLPPNGWTVAKSSTPGVATAVAEVSWMAARKKFVWRQELNAWQIYVYDEPLKSQTTEAGTSEIARTANVVIMESELLPSPFHDKFGGRTPYPQTVGSGKGWLLANGRSLPVEWRRPTADDLPRWYDTAGNEVALSPGNTWWLIVDSLDDVGLKLRLA